MQKFYDLARVFSSTTGTSSLLLGNAVPGFLTFADAGASDGDGITYCIRDGSNSEIGRGTLSYSGGLWYLARTTVLQSTNADAKISCTGAQEVFITLSSMDIADLEALVSGGTSVGAWKRWRVRNIRSAGENDAPIFDGFRFKLSGSAVTPDSVAYSAGAGDPSNLFAGTGSWVGGAPDTVYSGGGGFTTGAGPNWIEAVWSVAQTFDQIAVNVSSMSGLQVLPGMVRSFEIWVSNDGSAYFPLGVFDLNTAFNSTINLPSVWPWGGSPTGGLPAGGTTSQILKKLSATDGDADWGTGVLADPHTTHQAWRVMFISTQEFPGAAGGGYATFGELTFKDRSGSAISSAGEVILDYGAHSSFPAVNAFDGNAANIWSSQNPVRAYAPAGVGLYFATAKDVGSVDIRVADSYTTHAPGMFVVQYSDDYGQTWTTYAKFEDTTSWTSGETRNYALGTAGEALGSIVIE